MISSYRKMLRGILHLALCIVIPLSTHLNASSTIDAEKAANMKSRAAEERTYFQNLVEMQPFLLATSDGIPYMTITAPPADFTRTPTEGLAGVVEKANVAITLINAYDGSVILSKSQEAVFLKQIPVGLTSVIFHAAQYGGEYRYFIASVLLQPLAKMGSIPMRTPIIATVRASFLSN